MRTTDQHEPVTPTGTGDLLPTRESLLGRLKDWSDNTSWQVFFDTYWRLIYRVALKAGCTEAEAEEVVQQTMISAAKAMKNFQYDRKRGSFKGWLLQLTGWRITNQLRQRHVGLHAQAESAAGTAEVAGDEAPAKALVAPELERVWEAEWEEHLLAKALERVRRRANPKHYQIFSLCVLQQKPLKEVKQFLGVGSMEIYLSRHRVGLLVRKEMARLREHEG